MSFKGYLWMEFEDSLDRTWTASYTRTVRNMNDGLKKAERDFYRWIKDYCDCDLKRWGVTKAFPEHTNIPHHHITGENKTGRGRICALAEGGETVEFIVEGGECNRSTDW